MRSELLNRANSPGARDCPVASVRRVCSHQANPKRKEGCQIQTENVTFASVTFRIFPTVTIRAAGCLGTARNAKREEFAGSTVPGWYVVVRTTCRLPRFDEDDKSCVPRWKNIRRMIRKGKDSRICDRAAVSGAATRHDKVAKMGSARC